MHYRHSALLIGLLFALYGSAEAQQQTGPYIQVSPTPSKLSVGGPGFVQVDANGIASVVAQAPGSGTVTNTSGALASNSIVVGNGGSDIKTVGGSIGGTFTTAGNVSLTGAGLGLTLAFPANGPFTYTFPLATSTLASLAGSETFTNKIYSGGQLLGTFSGNPTFSGVPLFTNLSAGTQIACLGLDSGFHLVTLNASCGAGGGATTGSGVDGGTSAQSLTGTATISNGTRLVKVASGWVTGTLTLPAISAVSADTCIRIEDGGNFIDASHTLTVKGGASDGLNGGAANGTVGPFTTPGSFVIACVTATNNWNVGPGTIAPSSASSTQIVSGVDANGLTYGTIVAAVKTWWATPSSANLRSALTDETGTGAAYFQGGDIGTPSAGVGTNITSIPNNNVLAATLATGTSVSLTAPREYYVCTGTCTVTPPVPAAGYEFCVMNDDNVATVITLAAIGSSARYEATARTSYGTAGTGTFVSGGAAGDKVCLLGRDSTHYLTVSFNGTWTAN